MARQDDQLLHLPPVTRPRHGTTRALVPLPPGVCHLCGVLLVTVEATQVPLLRHGGYGEAKRGRVEVCPACRWVGGSRQDSLNPRPFVSRARDS